MQKNELVNVEKDLSKVVVSDIFEGPLDLLLYLIHVNEIDIYNIPISEITDQYLEYINVMRELDLDVAGEFLLMAARLVYIKSRMLLPRFDEGDDEAVEDPRAELVERLIEHEKFRATARLLREMEGVQSKYIPRRTENEIEVEFELDDLSIDELLRALQMTLGTRESYDYKRYTVNHIDINEKMELIIRSFEARRKARFSEIIPRETTKGELIVFFLAILELIRKKILKVVQRKFLGNIVLTRVGEC